MKYIWQLTGWPNFTYDMEPLQETLYLYAKISGEVSGGFQQIAQEDQKEALLDIIVAEALKTSEIEGEYYDQEDVRSSLKNHLGISTKKKRIKDKRAENISRLMVCTRETFLQDLSEEALFGWHKILMADHPDMNFKDIGKWRDGQEPMQIISGPDGQEKVHYQAPPSKIVAEEMSGFINWFNKTSPASNRVALPGPIRAAIAHLYFECIHPFEDGNGRVGRAISEKALSQDLGRPVLLSLSSEIMKSKKAYYEHLSKFSRDSLDISGWISYFTNLIYSAQVSTRDLIEFVLYKARFWREWSDKLNPRQISVLQRMFGEGPDGFKGGISASKYMKLTGVSKATATRDLTDLLAKGCIVAGESKGRSTRYDLPNFKAT